jgi:glyoxylase-like metal-dependent hydrolase (beta-lactamase superfamily II)
MRTVLLLAALAVSGCAIFKGGKERAEAPAPSLERIADNLWIHKSWRDVPTYGPILSQGMVVKTDAGILLVDTAWTDADTETLIELIKTTAGAAPLAGIVTHAHNDKMGGMTAANARMDTAAFAMTNEDAVTRGLTPARHSIDSVAIDKALAIQQIAPDGTVVARGEVELYYPGPGHTRDNIVVYYAPARVLFGGCLIRPADATNLGNTADGDVANWANAVRAVAERFPDAEIVIPSHGEKGGRELLDKTIALAEAAAANAE